MKISHAFFYGTIRVLGILGVATASLVGSLAFADPTFVVQAQADRSFIGEGETVTYTGGIFKINPEQPDQLKPVGDLESLVVKFYMGDYTNDVTKSVRFEKVKDEYQFSYKSAPVMGAEPSVLIVTLQKKESKAEKLRLLLSQFEMRLTGVERVLEEAKGMEVGATEIEILLQQRDDLFEAVRSIREKLRHDPTLLAERHVPVRIGNNQAAPAYSSSLFGPFRLELGFTPGVVVQGEKTRALSSVSYVSKPEAYKKLLSVDTIWRNALVHREDNVSLRNGNQVEHSFDATLSEPSGNVLELEAFEAIDSKEETENQAVKRKRLGRITLPLPVMQDVKAPTWVSGPLENSSHPYFQNTPSVLAEVIDELGVIDSTSISATLSGAESLDVSRAMTVTEVSTGRYQVAGILGETLPEGSYTLALRIRDHGQNQAVPDPLSANFIIDRTAPKVVLGAQDHIITRARQFSFSILTDDASPVSVTVLQNSNELFRTAESIFEVNAQLAEGFNTFQIIATDAASNSTTVSLTDIVLDSTAASLSALDPSDGQVITVEAFPSTYQVSVTASEALSSLILNDQALIPSEDRRTFSGLLNLFSEGGVSLKWVATDLAGNRTELMSAIDVKRKGVTPPPVPEPSLVAPAIDTTVPMRLADSMSFLYQGSSPVQLEVNPETIVPERMAVIRGNVLDRSGGPLSDVKISILDHPEFGYTRSQASGQFDMAVNGGGYLTLRYEKDGFIPLQRQLQVPWRDFAVAEDVVMTALDTKATLVTLGSASPEQIVRGSVVTDQDGARQATVLFPAGTEAQAVLPDGSLITLTQATVRATEFTVGDTGPKAMPANLPSNTGYTYAAEFSIDEALSAGATDIRFNKPVYIYVENFLGFPAGGAVPAGYYDRSKGQWIASENGRVIRIVAIESGAAKVDVNGDGAADEASALASLGFTDSELLALASLYREGQTIWRVPVTHFTPWDFNWPFGPPLDAVYPADVIADNEVKPQIPIDNPCLRSGSIIDCENQALGEAIEIAGTPFKLHYSSSRVSGGTAQNVVDIPVYPRGRTITAKSISVEMVVAGKRYSSSYQTSNAPEFVTYQWDGKDAYGRRVNGVQSARISITYLYQPVYYAVRADFERSFGRAPNLDPASVMRSGSSIPLTRAWDVSLGKFDTLSEKMGGFRLDVHHAYDSNGRTLILGNGSSRSASALGPVIQRIAGNGTYGTRGDGNSAQSAGLANPRSSVIAPDGSIFIADSDNHRVRKVSPNGIITTVAGSGYVFDNRNGTYGYGYNGDARPAIEAKLYSPQSVAIGPDGSIYIADSSNHRVRKIDKSGTIFTVAGNGYSCQIPSDYVGSRLPICGDGGSATAAKLFYPTSVGVASDGTLYIGEFTKRVRRVTTDGVIDTIAGGGANSPADQVATEALLGAGLISVSPSGTLYVTDSEYAAIYRMDANGILRRVAGSVPDAPDGDGGPAINAHFYRISGMSIGNDGSIFLTDSGAHTVRRVSPAGIVDTVAGNGTNGTPVDGGLALAAQLNMLNGVSVGPDGSLLITRSGSAFTSGGNSVHRIGSALPGFISGSLMVASQDGRELYLFDSMGRHISTRDSLTQAIIYSFAYTDGLLASITDASGNVTTIERDPTGTALAIVSPFGQRTVLTIRADGYLTSITNPAKESYKFTYYPGAQRSTGLMETFTDPRNITSRFTYDSLGRLIKDEDVAGGSTTLTRTESGAGFEIAITSALNRKTRSIVETASNGSQLRRLVGPDGTESSTVIGPDGITRTTEADGTLRISQMASDPRFLMQASYEKSLSVTTPGKLTYKKTVERLVQLQNPSDPLSLLSLTEKTTLNGNLFTSLFDTITRTRTETSAQGRVVKTLYDDKGRLVRQEVPGLFAVDLAYDAQGRLLTATQGVRETVYGYGGQGFLETVTNALNQTTTYQSDPVGRTLKQSFPDSLREVAFSYDPNGNLLAVTPPGKSAHEFSYTSVNLPEWYHPPTLSTGVTPTRNLYSVDRELLQVQRPDGKKVDRTYDPVNGRLLSVQSGSDQTLFSYEPGTGKPSSVVTSEGEAVSWSYDGPLVVQETYSGPISGAISRSFGPDFKVATQAVGAETPIAFGRDKDGLLIQVGAMKATRNPQNGLLTGTAQGAVSDTYSYNGYGELDSYTVKSGTTVIYELNLSQRDALGRISEKTEALNGSPHTYAYSYFASGELKEVKKNGAVLSQYSYDSNGNRQSVTTQNGTVTATYDAQDRLLTSGPLSFTYTESGDLATIKDSGAEKAGEYRYDVFGNLKSVLLPDGTTVEYVADGLGRRVGKKVNGVLNQGFLYDGQLQVVAELDGSGKVVSRFVYGTKGNVPDYMIKGGLSYRILSDQLGSPRLVVNTSDGSIAQEMEFDEFGKVIKDTSPGFQPFGFAGGLYDRDTKLVRFGARDYMAEIGRWVQKDPIGFGGGDTNLYGYVLNDPINLTDPTGLAACSYSITTHTMTCTSSLGDTYTNSNFVSGTGGPAQNNSAYNSYPFIGPLNQGTYQIGRQLPNSTRRNLIPLFSIPNGRGGFQTHGCGNTSSCSQGCIASPNIGGFNNFINNDPAPSTLTVY